MSPLPYTDETNILEEELEFYIDAIEQENITLLYGSIFEPYHIPSMDTPIQQSEINYDDWKV